MDNIYLYLRLLIAVANCTQEETAGKVSVIVTEHLFCVK